MMAGLFFTEIVGRFRKGFEWIAKGERQKFRSVYSDNRFFASTRN